MAKHEDIVQELKDLLAAKPGWGQLLTDSITVAKQEAVRAEIEGADGFPETLDEYYEYLAAFVKWIPGAHLKTDPKGDFDKDAFYQLARFYWLLDQPSGKELQTHEEFQQWMMDFAKDWGSFCDTPASITDESRNAFWKDTRFNITQYMHRVQEEPAKGRWSILADPSESTPPGTKAWWIPNSPSGWLTFNQFFAREVSPGMRPVAGMFDDKIVTAPADSTFYQKFKIDENSEITVKYTHKYDVLDLLEDSPYRDRFKGGLFMHSFLSPYDYHRFHAPVRGTVLESRAISGNVVLEVQVKDKEFVGPGSKYGKFTAPDSAGYQFTQERGLIVFDSPVGLVATLPIGMAQVSSVNMTAVKGAYLNKGDEFGYFMFGGSDIILLFEADSDVVITAAPNIHYNTGMCIGEVIP